MPIKSRLLILLLLPLTAYALPQNFVYLRDIDPSIQQDIRYASSHNFIGHPIAGYLASECVLTQPAAMALKHAQTQLKKASLSLKVYDCFRPKKAVDEFIAWSKQSDQQQMKAEFYPHVAKSDFFKLGYVAEKSGHTRGSTVDLTIVPIPTPTEEKFHLGQPLLACTNPRNQRFGDNSLDMGTGYDCMDALAHNDNTSISAEAYQHRQLLQKVMQENGFKPYQAEWWHFTLANEPYPTTYFDFDIDSHSQQRIIIQTNKGLLQRYERGNPKENWQPIGSPIHVIIGKQGLTAQKHEGDLRTPSGTFTIDTAFGFAPKPSEKIKLPYQPITETTVCVDDPQSRYYNQVLDQASIKQPDWRHAEAMHQIQSYKKGAILSYNTTHPKKGAGSCVFIHIARDEQRDTAGCVAMTESALDELLQWLDPSKDPKVTIISQ